MSKLAGVKYSQAVMLTQNTFHATDGYAFAFWTTDAAGMGTRFADGAEVSKLGSSVFNNDIVRLYAQWQGSPYSVTYDANAADATGSIANQTFHYGVWATLAKDGFAREGSNLIGWSTDKARADAGVAQYALGDQVLDLPGGAGSVVLYAVWTEQLSVTTPINPTVSVDAQGKITADTSTFFESKTSKPVKVASAVCAPVAGDTGTASVFPNQSQWEDIAVTLASASAQDSPSRLFLSGLATPVKNLTVPAKTATDTGKLSVSIGLIFLTDVALIYNANPTAPVATIAFTFEMGA